MTTHYDEAVVADRVVVLQHAAFIWMCRDHYTRPTLAVRSMRLAQCLALVSMLAVMHAHGAASAPHKRGRHKGLAVAPKNIKVSPRKHGGKLRARILCC